MRPMRSPHPSLQPVDELQDDYYSENDELRDKLLRLSNENDHLKRELRRAEQRERGYMERMKEMKKQLDELVPAMKADAAKNNKPANKEGEKINRKVKARERAESPHHRDRRKI